MTTAGANSPLRHPAGLDMLHWHDGAIRLPQGATLLASMPMTPCQAFSVGTNALALQFHPEVDAAKIEAWLIGHTAELRAACVNVSALRVSSARQRQEAHCLAACALLNEWLDSSSVEAGPGSR